MWKHIFGYGNTRFCLCQDTGAMNRPLRLTECSHPISWVYVECFAECTPRIRNPFRMHSRNVRNVFVICMLHIRHVKVWFLRHKSMVFGVQKPPFYIAKRWFLSYKKGGFVFRYNGRRFCRCWKTVLLCRGCGLRHCNFYAIVLVYQIAKSGTNVVASHIFYNVTEVCIYVYSIV